ncbi:intraflagellar transport protein 88-like isoform X1 [Dinothrombium tinctorium]|uniref:Intraflagellar transport protein 88-like isoform X1 n=1 Tax=Dinothrombium tinctorium TaxID=1965070 RepID=A0A443QMF9_9ACAR|nr:intraflagellar transport protein 88-like isoform X1 [Dinothrombium tinctorium]RWS04765.1 intraflagellar transport protein 88-like isoform X1 [Dinothrombium tinctorium]
MFANTFELRQADGSDLYSGYNDFNPVFDIKALEYDENFQQAVLKSSYGKRGIATGTRTAGPSRMGTAGYRRSSINSSSKRPSNTSAYGQQQPMTARPMTAVRGAGYTSHSRNQAKGTAFDPLNQAKSMISTFHHVDENSPEFKIKQLEQKVNTLLEESVMALFRNEKNLALEKAKEAVAKERSLSRMKNQASLDNIPINIELTFSVLFNLAIQYTKSEMFSEAINAYQSIIKNRSFTNTGRLKVNIGNIHFYQSNFPKAIKFYRMALDQMPNTQKATRMKLMRNIGLAFVKLNQYADAITSFEYIMSEKGDYRDALHLIICHFALGDKEKMKKCFIKLLETRDEVLGEKSKFAFEEDDEKLSTFRNDEIKNDSLRQIQREYKQERDYCIYTAAKLIAPVIGDTLSQGYDWCVEQIRNAGFSEMANELEINKAVKHLKKRNFAEAIETLQTFEKKESKTASTAATNLSFLYLLQNEIAQAELHADTAINADHYNAGALVNKGNCCLRQGEFEKAREYYKEALSNDPSCVEAIYNLALTYKKLSLFEPALDCLFKMHTLVKNHPHVIYQIAVLYEQLNDKDQAMDWYQTLLTFVPSDPALLNRLSDISESEGDKQQAFLHLTDVGILKENNFSSFPASPFQSYRYFPSYIPTIERIAAHYIENQIYEKAIKYLEKAAAVQPNQVKWLLMIAACYRRSGNYQQALQSYKAINKKFPENIECLKFLAKISQELGLTEANEYIEALQRLEKAKEIKERKIQSGRGSRSTSRSSLRQSANSASSREGSASSNSSGYITSASPRSNLSKSNSQKAIFENEVTNDDSFNEELTRAERPMSSWKRKEEDDFANEDIGDILPE